MKYLADILTALRLVAAFVVAACVVQEWWLAALVWFMVAVLSDAGDGYAARRWPYTVEDEKRLPWRRIDPHQLDNIPDALLVVLAVLTLAFKFDYWWWLMVAICSVSVMFMLVIQYLVRHGTPKSAERVDVIFGWWFATNLVMVIIELAFRSGYLWPTIAIVAIGGVTVAYFKRDRALTRPETRADAEAYQSGRRAT